MKKLYALSLGILLASYSFAQNDPFAPKQNKTTNTDNKLTPRSTNTTTKTKTNTTEANTSTNTNIDKQAQQSFYSVFAEKKLPLTLDILNTETAKKLIQSSSLKPLNLELMQQYFPIPAIKKQKDGSNTSQAKNYYPMGFVKLGDNTELFLCLEEWLATDANNYNWHIHAYTFKDRSIFIDDVLLSFASKSKEHNETQKAVFSPSFTAALTRASERTLNQNNEPVTYTATFREEVRINTAGKVAARLEKFFSGIYIGIYEDKNLPDATRREGKTLWGDYYRDGFGEHYALISYDTIHNTADKASGTAIQLHFYHYTKPKGAVKFEMLHQAVEQTKNCNLDIKYFLNAPRPIILTDIDKNGILEASILYWLDCRNTNAPSIQMLLTLWTGKYETHLPASVDLKTGKQTSFFNQYWSQVPESVRNYTTKLINKCASKTKMK